MRNYRYKTTLKIEFDRRKTGNGRYSLRAFARDLELDPSGLSNVMNGNLLFSLKAAISTAIKLKLDSAHQALLEDAMS